MRFASPSYLHRQGGIFHFRMSIPPKFRPMLGQTEVKRSLATPYLKQAGAKAMKLAVAVRGFLNHFDKVATYMTAHDFTPERLQALLGDYLREQLAEWETERATRDTMSDAFLSAYANGLEVSIWELEEALQRNDQGVVSSALDTFLEKHGVDIDKDSTEYKVLGRGILKNMLEALKVEQNRHQGDYSDRFATAPQLPPERPTYFAPAVEHVDHTKLSEAVEKYISIKSPTWATSSKKDIIPHLHDFVDMVGDKEVRSLTRDDMRQYHHIMHHIPKRRTTSPTHRGKSLAQLLNLDIPETDRLAAKTLDTTFTNIRSFVNWLEVEGLLNRDRPAKHLNSVLEVQRKQARADKRRRFTKTELQALFSPENFTPDSFRNSWQFWLPLMALMTGARIEELAQLHLTDIKQKEGTGVWFLDINAEDEKDVKTEAGKRMVPIHKGLIDLGLLDRVAALSKRKGTTRLFPTLNLRGSTGKLSGAATQWFTRYRRKCELGADKGDTSPLTFHSLRHSFITRCKHTPGIDRRMVKELVGHEQGAFDDVTAGYEGKFPVTSLYDGVVSKLDFSDVVDLDRLKGTKWVALA